MKIKSRTLLLILFIIILLPSFSFATKKNPPSKNQVSIQEISRLIWTGNSHEAFLRLTSSEIKADGISRKRLQFLKGYLTLKEGKAIDALPHFKNISENYSEIAPILPYYEARAQRLAGYPEEALRILKPMCDTGCDATPRLAREYALSLCNMGKSSDALQFFEALSQKHANSMEGAFARSDAIQCEIASKHLSGAYAHLRELYLGAVPGIPTHQLQSLLEILHREQPSIPNHFESSDSLARITSLKNQSRMIEAAEEFKLLWLRLSVPEQTLQRGAIAETFFKARFYADAAEHYAVLSQEQIDPTMKLDLLDKLASSYARSNQFDLAIQTQQQILSQRSGDQKSKVGYKIAFLLMDAGRCEKAITAFQNFIQDFPQDEKVTDALWKKGWCEYRTGKWQAALEDFSQIEKRAPQSSHAQRLQYWKKKITKILGSAPDSSSPSKFQQISATSLLSEEEKEMGTKIRTCPVISKTLSHTPPSFTLLKNVDAKDQTLLKELLALGLWEEFSEFYDLQNDKKTYDQSSLEEWMAFFAARENLPAGLVRGIIIQESRFQTKAQSGAGAMGLMQLIPQTAYEVAEDLDISSFRSQDLFHPIINLRFGIHYVGKMIKRFEGNTVQAVAAYNAGPEAVERWLKLRPLAPCDEFIEEIPYRETRIYVQKVMGNWPEGSLAIPKM